MSEQLQIPAAPRKSGTSAWFRHTLIGVIATFWWLIDDSWVHSVPMIRYAVTMVIVVLGGVAITTYVSSKQGKRYYRYIRMLRKQHNLHKMQMSQLIRALPAFIVLYDRLYGQPRDRRIFADWLETAIEKTNLLDWAMSLRHDARGETAPMIEGLFDPRHWSPKAQKDITHAARLALLDTTIEGRGYRRRKIAGVIRCMNPRDQSGRILPTIP